MCINLWKLIYIYRLHIGYYILNLNNFLFFEGDLFF